MLPILTSFAIPFTEWTVQLRAYGTFHVLALLVLFAVTARNYARDVGPSWALLDPFLVGIPAGMIGAVLLGGWTSDHTVRNPLELSISWQVGNKAAYGGLIAGSAAAAFTAWLRGLPVKKLLDAAAPGLALATVFARLGCFLAGCCYGVPTSSFLGVRFPDSLGAMSSLPEHATGLHPTQLYLAAAALLTAIVLLRLRRRRDLASGDHFALFVVLYAASVFAIGFLRADPGRWFFAGLSHSQWISLALLVAVPVVRLVRPLTHRVPATA
jgi:phosphatidylglycerol---prolipoprotein diacylglyceryl transferase